MVQLARSIFLHWSLSYTGTEHMGRVFWSSHVTHKTILQCLSHPLNFILTVWYLKCVLIKNDSEGE